MQRGNLLFKVGSISRKFGSYLDQLVGDLDCDEDRACHSQHDYQQYGRYSRQSKPFQYSHKRSEKKTEQHGQRKWNQYSSGEIQRRDCYHSGYEGQES